MSSTCYGKDEPLICPAVLSVQHFVASPVIVLLGRERHFRGSVSPDVVRVLRHVAHADPAGEAEGKLLVRDRAIDLDIVDQGLADELWVVRRVGPRPLVPDPLGQEDARRGSWNSSTWFRSRISSLPTRVVRSLSTMAFPCWGSSVTTSRLVGVQARLEDVIDPEADLLEVCQGRIVDLAVFLARGICRSSGRSHRGAAAPGSWHPGD